MGQYEPKPINLQMFGKYKGKTYEEIYETEPTYLEWLLNSTDPADTKNQGKYAKQNQERIAYLQKLLGPQADIQTGPEVVPVSAPTPVVPHPAVPKLDISETLLAHIISIEGMVKKLVARNELPTPTSPTDISPDELKPDEEVPF